MNSKNNGIETEEQMTQTEIEEQITILEKESGLKWSRDQKAWYAIGIKLGKKAKKDKKIQSYIRLKVHNIMHSDPIKDLENLMLYMAEHEINSDLLFNPIFIEDEREREKECFKARGYILTAYQKGKNLEKKK